MEVGIPWDGELGRVYCTGYGLKNLSIMCSSAPTSHNRALGLMAQQHVSEILPIHLGDLTCNGIICKHDTTTNCVLGDQTGWSPCALPLGLIATYGTLAPAQYNLLRTCCVAMVSHALNASWLGTCLIKPPQATMVLKLPSSIKRCAMVGGLGQMPCKRCLEEMEMEVKVVDGSIP